MQKFKAVAVLMIITEVFVSVVSENGFVCTKVSNLNGKGDLITSEKGISKEECCQKCGSHPKCNVFVYCPNKKGCNNLNTVIPYQKCDLKYQKSVAQGKKALYWQSGPSTDFLTGIIYHKNKSEITLSPLIASQPEPESEITTAPKFQPIAPLVARVNFFPGQCRRSSSSCTWNQRGTRFLYNQDTKSCYADYDCIAEGFATRDQCNRECKK